MAVEKNDINADHSNKKMSSIWLFFAVASALSYATYNMMTAKYIPEYGVFGCKAINSVVLGLAALTIHVRKGNSPNLSEKPKSKSYALAWMCGCLNVTGITLLFLSFD
jgi:drug/metabolite transporter (DMT)-like permease